MACAVVMLATGATTASATILGPSKEYYPGLATAWAGLEGVCHLQPDAVTGLKALTGLSTLWDCKANGRELRFQPGVPVGSTVDFRKYDLEAQGSIGGVNRPYPRALSRVRWDVGDDGTVEDDDLGPWPTASAGTGVPGDGNIVQVRGQLIRFSQAFGTLGTVPVRVTTNYDDGSTETASGLVPVVPDAVTASLVGPGAPITAGVNEGEFDARGSTSLSGVISGYEWDLDGNGTFETSAGSSIDDGDFTPGRHTVSVRVTSRGGSTDVASVHVDVTPKPPDGDTGVSINDGAQFTNSPNVMLSLVWPAGSTLARVSNDGGFKGALQRDLAVTVPWKLQSSGPERLPKTVYVRFGGTGALSYQDDIILDETPPTVGQASLAGASTRSAVRTAVAAKTRTYKLKIKASDKTSGVAGMQITSDRRKPGKVLRYSTKATFKTTKSSVYVRAKDRAGNFSKWRTARK